MRVPRVYIDIDCELGAEINLPKAVAHHLVKVLRMQPGRTLVIFNGRGEAFNACLKSVTKNHTSVVIDSLQPGHTESSLFTELAIGLSKGDRFDWVLQKATELGVSRIVPLFSKRSELRLPAERAAKKKLSWEKILASACEQSGLNTLPELVDPMPLEEYLPAGRGDMRLVLHPEADTEDRRAIDLATPPQSVSLLIGPEGGFSDHEIASAQHYDFRRLTLGPRILRTETAPVVALTFVQLRWGDFR